MATKSKSKPKSKTPSALAVDRAAPCSQLVVVPLDTTSGSLAEMRSAGYVPIMTDHPEKVRMLMPDKDIVGGDLLMAAMHGLMSEGDHSQTALYMVSKAMTELHRRLKERETEAAKQAPERGGE